MADCARVRKELIENEFIRLIFNIVSRPSEIPLDFLKLRSFLFRIREKRTIAKNGLGYP
jgi:hypothetical protein